MYRIAQHFEGPTAQFTGRYTIKRWIARNGDSTRYPGDAKTWKTRQGAQRYLETHPFLRNAEIEEL